MSVWYNDNNAYDCRVLRARVLDGSLPMGDVDERDITEIEPEEVAHYSQWHLFAGIGGFPLGLKWAGFPSRVRILTGGFPCQDISNAGPSRAALLVAGRKASNYQMRLVGS